jgi:cell division protein FtsL
MQKVVIGVIVVAAIALVVCLVPLKEVAYAVMVDFQDTEPLSYEVIKARGENVWLDCVSNSCWHYHFRCSIGT